MSRVLVSLGTYYHHSVRQSSTLGARLRMIRQILLPAIAAAVLFTAACGDGPQTPTPTPLPLTGRIAFESARDGGDGDIYVMNADGSDLTQMRSHPETGWNPAWSTVLLTWLLDGGVIRGGSEAAGGAARPSD